MAEVFPHTILAVGDRPVCVWDQEIERHNLDFCESVDPDWFVTSTDNHFADLDTDADIPQSVALSVRLIYHHALETFFALLFAAFQAPNCLPAWLELYRVGDIRQLIRAVQRHTPTLNAWKTARPSWEDLSRLFNQGDWAEDKDETTARFALSWRRFATEFLDDQIRSEYNCLKHGFRARPSGGAIRFGVEQDYGVPPPSEQMQLLGGSKHGSSAFTIEPIPLDETRGRAVHLQLKMNNIFWIAESTIQKIQLLAVSMKNILGAVRIRNGVQASDIRFHRFTDADAYEMPWRLSTGVRSFQIKLEGPGDRVTKISRDELLSRLREASGLKPKESEGTAPQKP